MPKKGRPTKYKPEYCKKIIEYFDQPLYLTVEVEKMSATGAIKTVKETVANDMPTFEGFAFDICKVCHDTILEWCKVHDKFSEAYKIAKGLQKKFVINHGMNGRYNSGFAKFFAINNLDMADRTEVKSENEHEVKGYGLAFDLSKKPEDI